MRATASAPSNIALVKYWGKRDVATNVPATGSISVTLDDLRTKTTVTFADDLPADECLVDGVPHAGFTMRVAGFLDLVRKRHGVGAHARVETSNNFPTGAGLASSASGFAALTLACDAALGLGLSPRELSALARRGSGSAARSLADGFVEMYAGVAADGSDAYAEPIAAPEHLPLEILVVVTTTRAKGTSSTEGMLRTEKTSPYYDAWLAATANDLVLMRDAIAAADLERVGTLAEGNCLRMHAAMLGASPPLLYWNGATVDVVNAVWELRAAGCPAYFTIDAGPQVKVLCEPGRGREVRDRLGDVGGVVRILATRPGRGAHLVEDAV